MEEVVNSNSIQRFPNEIIFKIFKLLSAKSLTACRAVCRKWQLLVDDLTKKDIIWQKHCETNYGDICHSAHQYSMPGLSWYQLYQSLTLWTRLSHAQETLSEICWTINHAGTCMNFQLLRDGVIAVLTDKCVMYYNVNTLRQFQKLTFADNNEYLMYKENDDTIILLLTCTNKLLVRRKNNRNDIVAIFNNVNMFMSVENNIIYYVTNFNIINKCTLLNGTYTSTRLVQSRRKVLALGYNNGILHILTYSFKLYAYFDHVLNPIIFNNAIEEELEAIKKYNFENHTDWSNECSLYKRYILKYDKNLTVTQNLHIIHVHGPVVFVGYKHCVLSIFYSLYTTSLIDLIQSEPIKVYNLLDRYKNKSKSTILNIAVVEGEHSHTVLVALPENVFIIKLAHPFCGEISPPQGNETSINDKIQYCSIREPLNIGAIQSVKMTELSKNSQMLLITSKDLSNIRNVQSDNSRNQSTSSEESFASIEDLSISSSDESNNSGEPLHKMQKIQF